MQAVRQRIVDNIEVRIGDQGLVALVYTRDAVFGRKGMSTRGIAGRHRGDHDFAVFLAGLMSADDAIRAAPRMPIRTRILSSDVAGSSLNSFVLAEVWQGWPR
jgi:hypothetical protein